MTRMVLEGRTTCISFAQLAFDFQETSRLWSQLDFTPSSGEGVSIFEDSRGWPAVAMAMTQTAKAARSHGSKAPGIYDSPIIADFLREEVFDSIPPATFRFLKLTSILPYFAESDCREFLSQVDEELALSVELHIEILYREFTLLERVIGRGYRCNPVVANYLKNNLAFYDKATYRSICAALAAMLEVRNKPNEAIPLALDGEDWDRAIRLILISYSQLGMTAGFIDLVNWLDRIAAEYYETIPELNIAKAMALIPTGKVEESEALLNRAESLLQSQEAAGARPANDFMVHCEIPIIRAYNNAWPVQIKLAPVQAPCFDGANLLVAADCCAYSYGNFHQDFIRNKDTLIGCPKLDSVDYTEKLTAIIANNDIKSLTITRMEIPCCGGLEYAAVQALRDSGKFIPWQVVTFSLDGRILD